MVFSEELFSRLLRELEVVLKYYWGRTQSLQQKIIDNFHLTNNQHNLTSKDLNPVIHQLFIVSTRYFFTINVFNSLFKNKFFLLQLIFLYANSFFSLFICNYLLSRHVTWFEVVVFIFIYLF